MEKITDINQLKKGEQIVEINEDKFKCYEFLCIHPHNSAYILAIESASQDAKKIYIKDLIEKEYYFGKFEKDFVLVKCLWQARKRVKDLENQLEEC